MVLIMHQTAPIHSPWFKNAAECPLALLPAAPGLLFPFFGGRDQREKMARRDLRAAKRAASEREQTSFFARNAVLH